MIVDSENKIANDPFVLSQTPEFKKIMAQECKPVIDYIAQQQAKNAPQPQVAAATTSKVIAPNPVSDQSVADAQKRSEATKANTAQMKAELTTKLADPNFLNPNKYDTDKSGLDADANRASLFASSQGVATGDESMALKRKINTLIKTKPEYKGAPYYLNINF
jgi:flagellar motor protein MotB